MDDHNNWGRHITQAFLAWKRFALSCTFLKVRTWQLAIFLLKRIDLKNILVGYAKLSGSLWHIHSCCHHHHSLCKCNYYFAYGAIFCFLWIFNDRWENLDLPTTRSSSSCSLACTGGWCKRYKMVQLMVKEVVSLPATKRSTKTISKLCRPFSPWKLGCFFSFSISFK